MTVLVFSDFQCSSCRTAAQALNRLAEEFAREITLVYSIIPCPALQTPLPLPWRRRRRGRRASFGTCTICCMKGSLSGQTQQSPLRFFGQWAAQLGLDVEQFRRDVASEEVAERVRQGHRRRAATGDHRDADHLRQRHAVAR